MRLRKAAILLPGDLLLDPDFRVCGKDHGHCLFRCVFGRLLRIRASPLGDTGTVAFHRGSSGAARRLESPQHRFGGNICCRIDSRDTPNHHVLQHRQCRQHGAATAVPVGVNRPANVTMRERRWPETSHLPCQLPGRRVTAAAHAVGPPHSRRWGMREAVCSPPFAPVIRTPAQPAYLNSDKFFSAS